MRVNIWIPDVVYGELVKKAIKSGMSFSAFLVRGALALELGEVTESCPPDLKRGEDVRA